jgi:hypothetical protein
VKEGKQSSKNGIDLTAEKIILTIPYAVDDDDHDDHDDDDNNKMLRRITKSG